MVRRLGVVVVFLRPRAVVLGLGVVVVFLRPRAVVLGLGVVVVFLQTRAAVVLGLDRVVVVFLQTRAAVVVARPRVVVLLRVAVVVPRPQEVVAVVARPAVVVAWVVRRLGCCRLGCCRLGCRRVTGRQQAASRPPESTRSRSRSWCQARTYTGTDRDRFFEYLVEDDASSILEQVGVSHFPLGVWMQPWGDFRFRDRIYVKLKVDYIRVFQPQDDYASMDPVYQ